MNRIELKKLLRTCIELSSWSEVLGSLSDAALEEARKCEAAHTNRGDATQSKYAILHGRMATTGEVLKSLTTAFTSEGNKPVK